MADAQPRDAKSREPLDPGIRPGIVHRDQVLITDQHLTRHMGGKGVFATPAMIWLMEEASHNSVAPYLSARQTTVGYEVHVFHRAPARLGDRILVEAQLAEVDRNRLTFDVKATKEGKLLGEGLHRRAVVNARD